MKFSIIVCTYNRAAFLGKCIESIENNEYCTDEYEVVIVNNNSSDSTNEVVEKLQSKYSNIVYTLELKTGLSYARNKGIEVSKGEVLVFFDDDAIVTKGYLDNLEKYLSKHKFELAAGHVNSIWTVEKPEWFTDTFASIIGQTLYGEEARELTKNEHAVGANMIIKRCIFEKVGMFNVELGIKGDVLCLGEETDLFNNARKEDYKVYYLPKCSVDHHVHLNKVDKEYIMNRLILEGDSNSKMIKSYNNKSLVIKEILKRCIILLIRDIPCYIVANIFRKNQFEKKVTYLRNKAYLLGLL